MRTALLLLAACAAPMMAAHEMSPDFVCRPPPTIAGTEPEMCYWTEGEGWCVYDVGSCASTWSRETCDDVWVEVWAACDLPRGPLGAAKEREI